MLEEDDDDLDEGWRITRDMMDKIDNSEYLRKELADGGLRQMIAEIDFAGEDEDDGNMKRQTKRPRVGRFIEPSPREVALMRAKHSNPKFAKFIDRLLVTAGVCTEGEKSEEAIAAFLTGKDTEPLGHLTLAPIVKKGARNIQPDVASDNKSSDSEGGSE